MHLRRSNLYCLPRRARWRRLLALLLAAVCLLAPWPAAPVQGQAPTSTAVMVEFDAPPTARIYAAALAADPVNGRASATRAAQAHLARLDAAQRELLPRLAQVDATVLYRTQRVYNGIALRIDRAHLAGLAQLPGVKAVHPLRPKTPDLTHSTPHIGGPALWAGLAGLPAVQGEGIRIGIIDTGIDYLHVDFGGPGVGYAQNDRRIIGDVVGFPSAKIAGGYDFVGETYNADPAAGDGFQPLPEPDPDPYDCYAHGTHVAGIAGGYGVTADGRTYTGSYGADLDAADFSIGPGVAPHAQLYALKVFGCTGSSDVVDLAIEWAVDPNGDGDFADRMDVINLSLGSPYGDAYDTTAAAADNAAAAGVIVVASAGNSRDNYFIVGAPSTGDGVVSVAATTQTTTGASFAAAGDAPVSDTVAAFSSRGPRRGDAALKPEIAAPGVAIVSAAAGSGNGARSLSGTSMAAPHVAGALALLRQLHPDWRAAELKALLMNSSSTLVSDGNQQVYAPGRIGAGRIDLAAAGAATAVAFDADHPARVGISFGAPAVIDHYSAVRNVRIVNKAQAPASYVAAYLPVTDLPGVTVIAPATPITVAAQGELALPLQFHADASTMQDVRDPTVAANQGATRAWLSEASGHLMFWPQGAALHATLVDADGAAQGDAALTFDPATHTLEYHVTLTDRAAARATRVAVTVHGRSLADTVTADGRGVLTLTPAAVMALAAQQLLLQVTPAVGTFSGRITSAAPVLHLPVYAAPRAVANLRAAGPLDFPSDTTVAGALQLVGTAPLTAPVSLSILQLASPNSLPPGAAPGEIDRFDHADLRYVGVAGAPPAGGGTLAETTLYFALTTYAPWSTPNEVQFSVYIDRNEDGYPDGVLVNSNVERFLTSRTDNDAYVTVFYDLNNDEKMITGPLNGIDVATVDTLPLLNATMVLGVNAATLGLSAEDTGFDYQVVTVSNDLFGRENMTVEETPMLHFDLRGQPYTFAENGAGALLASLAGDAPFTLRSWLNVTRFLDAGQPRLLLLHHRSAPENAAETPSVRYAWPHQVRLPLVAR